MMVKQGIGYVERDMHGLFPGLTLERNLTISSVDRMCVNGRIHSGLERAVAVDTAERMV